MVFPLDHVEILLKSDSVYELRNADLAMRDLPNAIENDVALRYVCLSYTFFSISKFGYTLASLVYKRKVH